MKNGIVEFSEQEKTDLRFQLHKYQVHLCSIQTALGNHDCDKCEAHKEQERCVIGAAMDFLDKKGKNNMDAKDEQIQGVLCKVNISGNYANHALSPVMIDVAAGGVEASARELIGCDKVSRLGGIEIDGQEYALYYDANGRLKEQIVATYPIRNKKGKVEDLIVGSVVVIKENERGKAQSMSDKEQQTVIKHLDEQSVVAGMAIEFSKLGESPL